VAIFKVGLSMLAKLIRPVNILEIGTPQATQHCACAKKMQDNGQLHTIDIKGVGRLSMQTF
jgi:predicted O-methyltransferase YrrM